MFWWICIRLPLWNSPKTLRGSKPSVSIDTPALQHAWCDFMLLNIIRPSINQLSRCMQGSWKNGNATCKMIILEVLLFHRNVKCISSPLLRKRPYSDAQKNFFWISFDPATMKLGYQHQESLTAQSVKKFCSRQKHDHFSFTALSKAMKPVQNPTQDISFLSCGLRLRIWSWILLP